MVTILFQKNYEMSLNKNLNVLAKIQKSAERFLFQ